MLFRNPSVINRNHRKQMLIYMEELINPSLEREARKSEKSMFLLGLQQYIYINLNSVIQEAQSNRQVVLDDA